MKVVYQPMQQSPGADDPGGRRKPAWPAGSEIDAEFSECGMYRYALEEVWNADLPLVMFLMMNPSVASIAHADPTLIKTGKFARALGYGGQLVGNVHAYPVADSKLLVEPKDPVGPGNDAALLTMVGRAEAVVLAYGLPPKPLRPRAQAVVKLLGEKSRLQILRLTADGTPGHPLYLPSHLRPMDYTPAQ
ncbi:DUF1643 domain-containing protein [Acidovorax sp. LjRoot118]